MKPIDSPERCPIHHTSDPTPKTAWPPGPRAGLTGWRFLRAMSRDLLGSLSAWRQAHGDLVHLRIWPEHQILVADPHVARELLVGHHDALIRWEPGMRAFARSQGHSVLVAEGESWKGKRRALQPSFSHRASRDALPLMVAATRRALDRWAAQADTLAVDDALTALTVDIITRLLFSRDAGSASPQVRHAVHTLLAEINSQFYRPLTLPDWLPWNRERRDVRRLLLNMIASRVQERLASNAKDWPDDLLSRLLHLHLADPVAWTSQDVLDECMTAFLAGHETLAATLVWWAWCMAAHPHEQARVHAEVEQVLGGHEPTSEDLDRLPLLSAGLQETMRLYPAAPALNTRRATRAIDLGGHRFPAGTLFLVAPYLMQRDSRWFAEPDAFRPDRFLSDAVHPKGAYMPFGAGPRVCLGQAQAVAEMTVVAGMVLQRFGLVVKEGALEPRAEFNVSLRPAGELGVGVVAR